MARLLEHDINAAAFLMDEDLLEAAESKKKGFQNDLDRAVLDLVRQVPHAVFDAVFPAPPPTEQVAVATSDPQGATIAEAGAAAWVPAPLAAGRAVTMNRACGFNRPPAAGFFTRELMRS